MAEDERISWFTASEDGRTRWFEYPAWGIAEYGGAMTEENWKDPETARTWLDELEILNARLHETCTTMEKIIGPKEPEQRSQADITCLADDVSVRIFDAVAQADLLYEQAQRLVLKIKRNSTDYGSTTNT